MSGHYTFEESDPKVWPLKSAAGMGPPDQPLRCSLTGERSRPGPPMHEADRRGHTDLAGSTTTPHDTVQHTQGSKTGDRVLAQAREAPQRRPPTGGSRQWNVRIWNTRET